MFKQVLIPTLLFMTMLSGTVMAAPPDKHEHSKRWHQEKWCREHGGTIDAVLQDLTRSDCVTDTHAVALELAQDWAKALSHALYYSMQTGKKPGVVLIIEDEKQDLRYWLRLNTTILHFKLSVETWETWD